MNSITPIELKKAAQQMPASPKVFAKLNKLVRDMDASLEDITALVCADSSLAAHVLRISNSAYYAQCDKIDSVEEAINRIGFSELFRLVGVASSSQLFNEKNITYQMEGSQIWENSLACSIAMEFLAEKSGGDTKEAYTIGLLRSIGKMVLDICSKEDGSYDTYNIEKEPPLLDWEQGNFGIKNPTVASFILISWNFPENVSNAIEYHFAPEEAAEPDPSIYQLKIANSIVHDIGKGLPGEAGYWDISEDCLAKAGLSDADLEEASLHVVESLDEVVNNIG